MRIFSSRANLIDSARLRSVGLSGSIGCGLRTREGRPPCICTAPSLRKYRPRGTDLGADDATAGRVLVVGARRRCAIGRSPEAITRPLAPSWTAPLRSRAGASWTLSPRARGHAPADSRSSWRWWCSTPAPPGRRRDRLGRTTRAIEVLVDRSGRRRPARAAPTWQPVRAQPKNDPRAWGLGSVLGRHILES